jgi:hypothetical protein
VAREGGDKPPAKKAPAKRARKSAPRPTTRKAPVTDADREAAKAQISNVVPIKRPRKTTTRGRAGTAPTGPAGLRLLERRQHALTMRKLGYTYAEIAADVATRFDMPAYRAGDASNDVRALLDSVTIEAVQGVREEDLAILASLQRSNFIAAQRGDVKATRVMLDILDARAKYLGLYAPTRHELTGAGGGPLEIDTSDPGAVFAAAVGALDDLLPTPDAPKLPSR